MEKYGVDVDQDRKKEAGEGKRSTCPSCGSELLFEQANVPICPKCGTRPFEKVNGSAGK